MKHVQREIGGRSFTLRAYDAGGLVVDSWMKKLAYYVADDYCNPPGYSWAVFISEPLQAMYDLNWNLQKMWPVPQEPELQFLEHVRAVIVKAGLKSFEVDYFHDISQARQSWLKLKAEAEGLHAA